MEDISGILIFYQNHSIMIREISLRYFGHFFVFKVVKLVPGIKAQIFVSNHAIITYLFDLDHYLKKRIRYPF